MMPIMVPDILQADDEMKEKSIAVLEDLFQVKQYFQASTFSLQISLSEKDLLQSKNSLP